MSATTTPAARHRDRLVIFGFALLVVLVFLPVTYHQLWGSDRRADFKYHADFAREIFTQRTLVVTLPNLDEPAVVTHFLWHILIGLPAVAFHLDYWLTSFIAALGLQAVTAVILFSHFLWLLLNAPPRLRRLIAGGLALILLLVAPIYLLTVPFRMLYLPYIGINVYHNPTINLLKPFALIQFIAGVNALTVTKPAKWRTVLGLALLAAISMFAKPSYGLCYIPALGLLAAKRQFIDRAAPDWRVLVVGLALPTIVILAAQYLLFFGASSEGGLVFGTPQSFHYRYLSIFAPWLAWLIPLWLLMSALFPLAVALSFPRRVIQHTPFVLATLTFAVSLFFAYFVNESGERGMHGNFVWSAQIALFILFFATLWFLIDHRTAIFPSTTLNHPTRRVLIILTTLAAHLIAGGICLYPQCVNHYCLFRSPLGLSHTCHAHRSRARSGGYFALSAAHATRPLAGGPP